MARKPKAPKRIDTLTHDAAKRTNIPTAEFESVMEDAEMKLVCLMRQGQFQSCRGIFRSASSSLQMMLLMPLLNRFLEIDELE